MRVIAPPDVGGGLGPKASFNPEEALVCWLARCLRRPVKWIEDRLEHFLSAAREREQVHTVEIAFAKTGTLLALRDVFDGRVDRRRGGELRAAGQGARDAGGDGVNYAMMARGAGYRDAFAVRTLEELNHPER